jgi:hypothetical protein
MATIRKIHEWLFCLTENTLAAAPTDKTAKVKTRSTGTTDGIAARIVQERTEYRREPAHAEVRGGGVYSGFINC